MKNEPRAAVYSGTRNVYSTMETAAKSLIAHDGADEVYFLIEDEKFPRELPEFVHTIDVSKQTYIQEGSANWRSPFTYMASIRLAYPDIFKEYDRILSLDIDTMVTGSLDGLWKTYLDEVYFAACAEYHTLIGAKVEPYYNIGVTLMNLKKMREGDFWKRAVEMVNTERRTYLDQDILTEMCNGYTITLPIKYNYNPPILKTRELPKEEIAIRHYAGESFFSYREKALYIQYEEMPWSEAIKRSMT